MTLPTKNTVGAVMPLILEIDVTNIETAHHSRNVTRNIVFIILLSLCNAQKAKPTSKLEIDDT